MYSRDILGRFFPFIHMIILISLEQNVIEKEISYFINVYKLRIAIGKYTDSQTLKAHPKRSIFLVEQFSAFIHPKLYWKRI